MFDERLAQAHDEGDKLTDAVRAKLKESGSVAQTGRSVEGFRSWSKLKAWVQNPANYARGTTIIFIRNMKGIALAGEVARVEFVRGNYLHLDNGVRVYVKSAADFIEVGEMREIELCKGDLIQFNVNLRDRKIYNGNITMITDVPGEVMMLHADGKPCELVKLPEEYATFKYGWVMTSHKSQGRTAENVVVAAQALDRKAFYVTLSRGHKHMALHCPEKEFLKQQLDFRIGDRLSVYDLVKDRQILTLSQDAMNRKAETLPDTTYKSIAERVRKLAHYAKAAVDIEFKFPFGWGELEGIHHRGTWDMSRHQEYSTQNLEYFDPATGEKYLPTVVETSVGLDRTFLAVLSHAYDEEKAPTKKEGMEEDVRIVLHLPARIAPVQVAVMPLSKKLNDKALALRKELWNTFRTEADVTGNIGKRYRRQDEIGTPFCVTYDFDSETDNAVTVRDRDTMAQERVSLDNLKSYLSRKIYGF